MKYLIIIFLSITSLFGYYNISIGSTNANNTTPGLNATTNLYYDFGTKNINDVLNPARIGKDVWVSTNQTDILTFQGVSAWTIDSKGTQHESKLFMYDAPTATHYVISIGDTNYNSNWSTIGPINSSPRFGSISIQPFYNATNKYIPSGAFTTTVVFNAILSGGGSTQIIITLTGAIEEFINLSIGSSNFNDTTIGSNINNYNYNFGETNVSNTNRIWIPIYLSSNSDKSITLNGGSCWTTDSQGVQYPARCQIRTPLAQYYTLGIGDGTNSYQIWNGGINQGTTEIQRLFIDSFHSDPTYLPAGQFTTTTTITMTVN